MKFRVQHLLHGFWTCSAVGVYMRVGWWQFSAQIGIPRWFSNLLLWCDGR